MKISKKICILIVGLIAMFFLLQSFMFCASGRIIDAAVNEENGNVSILTDTWYIKTYSVAGTLLYEKKLEHNAGGYAHLDYVDGVLCVKMLRTDVMVIMNEKGEAIQTQKYFLTEEDQYWNEGWEKEGSKYVYQTDTHKYTYHAQNFWRVAFGKQARTFEIVHLESQKTITIWSMANEEIQ